MEKEDVVLLVQLLHTMQDLVTKLDEYYKKEDAEKLAQTKKEIMDLQQKIDKLV